jgi:translation initiation factor 2 subunit 3
MVMVYDKKPLFNVGIIGSVSAGKSSLVKSITNIVTQRHSKEKIRNITINVGYGNYNHISFVDCPGHTDYLDKTINAVKIMDGAILVVAADTPVVKSTILSHLNSVIYNNIQTKLIVCINKIDLVNKEAVKRKKLELEKMLSELKISPFAIIPVCFNKKINVNIVEEMLIQMLPEESFVDKSNEPFELYIIRSFDINKPGTNINNMKGGVIGGSIKSGKLSIGDKIKIDNLKGVVTEIRSDNLILKEANNGGLIAVGTDIDPSFMKANNLTQLFLTRL